MESEWRNDIEPILMHVHSKKDQLNTLDPVESTIMQQKLWDVQRFVNRWKSWGPEWAVGFHLCMSHTAEQCIQPLLTGQWGFPQICEAWCAERTFFDCIETLLFPPICTPSEGNWNMHEIAGLMWEMVWVKNDLFSKLPDFLVAQWGNRVDSIPHSAFWKELAFCPNGSLVRVERVLLRAIQMFLERNLPTMSMKDLVSLPYMPNPCSSHWTMANLLSTPQIYIVVRGALWGLWGQATSCRAHVAQWWKLWKTGIARGLRWPLEWSLTLSNLSTQQVVQYMVEHRDWLNCEEWTRLLRDTYEKVCPPVDMATWAYEADANALSNGLIPIHTSIWKEWDAFVVAYQSILRTNIAQIPWEREVPKGDVFRAMGLSDLHGMMQDLELSRWVRQGMGNIGPRIQFVEATVWQMNMGPAVPLTLCTSTCQGYTNLFGIAKPLASITWFGKCGWVRLRVGGARVTLPPIAAELWTRLLRRTPVGTFPMEKETRALLSRAGLLVNGKAVVPTEDISATWDMEDIEVFPEHMVSCVIVSHLKHATTPLSWEHIEPLVGKWKKEGMQLLNSLCERGYATRGEDGLYSYVPFP